MREAISRSRLSSRNTTMSKHAFLIIAHEHPDMLRRLVASLDDPENDIFIHIDRKVDRCSFEVVTRHSSIGILEDPIDGRWGDFSLVDIEFRLLDAAVSKGDYDYLHLISGVDYPLMPTRKIRDFCNAHKGKEFIGFAQEAYPGELQWRSQHWFLFPSDFKTSSLMKKATRAVFARLQSLVCFRRCPLEIKKGSQWWSISGKFARYILSEEPRIRKWFSHTYCPDEMVVQTICWNSPFRDAIYSVEDEFKGCKRFIPWKDGQIQPLTPEMFAYMKKSGRWFARKFDPSSLREFSKAFEG